MVLRDLLPKVYASWPESVPISAAEVGFMVEGFGLGFVAASRIGDLAAELDVPFWRCLLFAC